MTVTERTYGTDLDLVLARILSEPTWAHRLLLAAAHHLETDQPFQICAPAILTEALDHGYEQVCAGLPEIVANEAAQRAVAVLPELRPDATAGEVALKLRAAAGGV
jgi:hypothetical protein